jgi:hypothetical protein
MIEQRWCTTDGTSWTLSHDKYWAHIELSFDNTSYFASIGSVKDRPLEELSWDEINKDDWSGDFDCLKRAKAACIWSILNKKEQAEAIASLSPYEGIFNRENYDDQS